MSTEKPTITLDPREARIDAALDAAAEKLRELAADRPPPPPIEHAPDVSPEERAELERLFPGAFAPGAPAPEPVEPQPPHPSRSPLVLARAERQAEAEAEDNEVVELFAENEPSPPVAALGQSAPAALPSSDSPLGLDAVVALAAEDEGSIRRMAHVPGDGTWKVPAAVGGGIVLALGAAAYLDHRAHRAAEQENAEAMAAAIDEQHNETMAAVDAVDEKATLAGAVAVDAHERAGEAHQLGVRGLERTLDLSVAGQRQATATMEAITQVRREVHESRLPAEERGDASDADDADPRAARRKRHADAERELLREQRREQRERKAARKAPSRRGRSAPPAKTSGDGSAIKEHLRKTEGE